MELDDAPHPFSPFFSFPDTKRASRGHDNQLCIHDDQNEMERFINNGDFSKMRGFWVDWYTKKKKKRNRFFFLFSWSKPFNKKKNTSYILCHLSKKRSNFVLLYQQIILKMYQMIYLTEFKTAEAKKIG